MNDPPDPGGSIPSVACNVTVMSQDESSADTDHTIVDWAIPSNSRKRSKTAKICKHCNKKKRKHKMAGKSEGCLCVDSDEKNSTENAEIPEKQRDPSTLPALSENISQPQAESANSRKFYGSCDVSPYIVHVQREQTTFNDSTTLHPVNFGQFLKKHNFSSIINGSVKRIGRNRVVLAFNKFEAANSFICDKRLQDESYKAFVPSFNVTRMGLVRGVPHDWTPEEIKEKVTLPDGCGDILKVRRINHKVVVDGNAIWKPTQSIVITFDGQILPSRIFVCYNALSVERYIYPTVQCFNCCRFGHTKLQCRSKPRCFKCGNDHTSDTCTIEEEVARCCNCSGSHFAIKRICPEYERQRRIKVTMANDNLSYFEAAKLHPQANKSYSDVLVSSPTKTQQYTMTTNRPTQNLHSYKKTIFIKPKQSVPSQNMGYNQALHYNMIKDYDMPSKSGNGSVIKNDFNHSCSQDLTIADVIIPLLKFVTQFHNPIPSNVAPLLDAIQNLTIHNGSTSQSGTMELPKYQ